MELLIVARHALMLLEERGIRVERVWAGTFLTAIEMASCSQSLLVVDDDRLARLDAAASAPAWVQGYPPQALRRRTIAHETLPDTGTPSPAFKAVLKAVCTSLREAEPRLTELDQAVGDGDLGISLARGANAILADLPTARFGAGATAAMTPRRGRSSYMADRTKGHPDPGAVAAVIWLDACAAALSSPAAISS
jgi:dihydroxyacetone kinase